MASAAESLLFWRRKNSKRLIFEILYSNRAFLTAEEILQLTLAELEVVGFFFNSQIMQQCLFLELWEEER